MIHLLWYERRRRMTLEEILAAKEGENFEFKTAENRFSYTELQKYACAISNDSTQSMRRLI